MDLPLHPISVHFPIALSVFIPLFALIITLGIRRWGWPNKVWSLVIVMNLLLLVSSLVAVKLGEQDEDLVEKVVQKQLVHDHEEWGEKIPWFAGGALALSILPLLFRRRPLPFYLIALLGSIAMVVPMMLTGHSGGKLVYIEGAANAHIKKPVPSAADDSAAGD